MNTQEYRDKPIGITYNRNKQANNCTNIKPKQLNFGLSKSGEASNASEMLQEIAFPSHLQQKSVITI